MITPQSARLKATNNKAKSVTFISLIAATVLTAVYMAIPAYKGIVGMVLITAIVVAVFVYTKYLAPIYFYDIGFDGYGVPVFIVREMTGRRQSTFARVSLADITEIKRESAEERKKHKPPQGYRSYIYSPTLDPDVTYRLTVVNRYEKAEIVIEVSEEYAAMLWAYAEEARANYPKDTDE